MLGVILGGIGYAAGQFLSQRRKGAGEALAVALDEIKAVQTKADRLTREVEQMRGELTRLEAENRTLRNVLAGGTFLADQIKLVIGQEIDRGVVRLIEELGP